MTSLRDRRRFLTGAVAAVCLGSLAAAADRKRKMTIDLVCGMLGVQADLAEAVRLAAAHGFESVAPDPAFLAKLTDAESKDFVAGMKSKGVAFGAAGLPVDF